MSASSQSVVKEGWAWKVGGSVQTWKKRYMVLQGATLNYYKSDKDHHSSTPKGSISLDGASISALLTNNEYSSSANIHNTSLFGITPTHSSRMYVIQASSLEERDQWITACCECGAFVIKLTSSTSKTQIDSLLEGWIDRMTSSRFGIFGGSPHVERVYCALFVDKLAIWRSAQTSSTPIDHVLLTQNSLLNSGAHSTSGSEASTTLLAPFELLSKKGDTKYTFQADTLQQKVEWLDAIGCVIRGMRYEHPAYSVPLYRTDRSQSIVNGRHPAPSIATNGVATPKSSGINTQTSHGVTSPNGAGVSVAQISHQHGAGGGSTTSSSITPTPSPRLSAFARSHSLAPMMSPASYGGLQPMSPSLVVPGSPSPRGAMPGTPSPRNLSPRPSIMAGGNTTPSLHLSARNDTSTSSSRPATSPSPLRQTRRERAMTADDIPNLQMINRSSRGLNIKSAMTLTEEESGVMSGSEEAGSDAASPTSASLPKNRPQLQVILSSTQDSITLTPIVQPESTIPMIADEDEERSDDEIEVEGELSPSQQHLQQQQLAHHQHDHPTSAKNANIAEAIDFELRTPRAFEDEDGVTTPPTATDQQYDDDTNDMQLTHYTDPNFDSPATDFPSLPRSASELSAHHIQSLSAHPDVLLQLNALLTSRFHNDAEGMIEYLHSFTEQILRPKLEAKNLEMLKEEEKKMHGGSDEVKVPESVVMTEAKTETNSPPNKMSSKLSRMLIAGGGGPSSSSSGQHRRHESSLTSSFSSLSSFPHPAPKPPRMLHIHLLEGCDLKSMDSNGFSDPYCVLHISSTSSAGSEKHSGGNGHTSKSSKDLKHSSASSSSSSSNKIKSKTILETLSPIWDQHMTLDISDSSQQEELIVDVYDFDKYSTDDFIGRACIPLSSLKQHLDSFSGWFPIHLLTETWTTVGSVFLAVVLDEHYIEPNARQASNLSFLQARAQCLQKQEMKYFHSMMNAPPAVSSSLTHSLRPSTSFSSLSTSHLPLPPAEKLLIHVATFNVGNAPPPLDMSDILPLYTADLYIIGVQEADYTPRRDMKTCSRDWQCALVRHFGRDYTMIKYLSLWQIRIAVFVVNRHVASITNIHSYREATGIGNVLGNKGATIVALQYKSIKLCFVNSHLAAHQNSVELRNSNYRSIVRNVHVGPQAQSDILSEYHHVVWMGDLNYRLDWNSPQDSKIDASSSSSTSKTPSKELFDQMLAKISTGNQSDLDDLFRTDQLQREMRSSRSFVGFTEGRYLFPPTFKLVRGPGQVYTSQRSPAWCDRILTRSVPGFGLTQLSLNSVPSIETSDHKPVIAMYELDVPYLPSPLDRSLGETIIRLHDLRCTGLKAASGKDDVKDQASNAKDLDPQLIFLANFLPKPIVTPIVKKTSSPQFTDLPPSPSTYTEIRRIRQTLIYVRVVNHQQSQDAIIGRAIIPLHDLQLIEDEPLTDDPAEQSVPLDAASQKGKPQGMRFQVELTFGGMPAGSLSGQLTIMWKARNKNK